jgi:cytoskeletal protein CcmA (bactofilin family)
MAKNDTPEQITTNINLIATGTTITGDIDTSGDIRIDGNINGNIKTKGRLVVGPTGLIEGSIICQNGDLTGTVKGNIFVDEVLTLRANSKINGDIKTQKIIVESGAVFCGNCDMSGNNE